MNLEQYKHIIFDFDHTLVKLLIDWSFWNQGVNSIVKKYNPDFNQNTPVNMYDIHKFINQYGQDFRNDYTKFEIDFEIKHYQGYRLIDKSFTLLQKALNENKNLYLVTSNCKEIILPILKELKIIDKFKKIVAVNDVDNLKPSIKPFELISDETIEKVEWLMVGDSQSDREFAKNVGVNYLDIKDF